MSPWLHSQAQERDEKDKLIAMLKEKIAELQKQLVASERERTSALLARRAGRIDSEI